MIIRYIQIMYQYIFLSLTKAVCCLHVSYVIKLEYNMQLLRLKASSWCKSFVWETETSHFQIYFLLNEVSCTVYIKDMTLLNCEWKSEAIAKERLMAML